MLFARYMAVSASRSKSSGRSILRIVHGDADAGGQEDLVAAQIEWARSAGRACERRFCSRPRRPWRRRGGSRIRRAHPRNGVGRPQRKRARRRSGPAARLRPGDRGCRWTILKRSMSRKSTMVRRSGSRRERSIDCFRRFHEQRAVGKPVSSSCSASWSRRSSACLRSVCRAS